MHFLSIKNSLLIGIGLILFSCSPSKEKRFEKEVEEQNRLYPMMIDPHTRIDSIQYVAAENTLLYYYSLLGDADNAETATLTREKLEKRLPADIKSAQGLEVHRNHKVTMEYVYFSDSNKNELFRISITPDMYR